jgi:hypothetical protein
MRREMTRLCPFLGALLLFFLSGPALLGQQPTRVQEGNQFKQLAPGILVGAQGIFTTDSLPGYHVQVQDLVMGPKQEAPQIPLEGFAFMELRSGTVEVTIDGKSTRQEAGAWWFVRRGARVAIRNLEEVATIRAIVFTPVR